MFFVYINKRLIFRQEAEIWLSLFFANNTQFALSFNPASTKHNDLAIIISRLFSAFEAKNSPNY